MGFIKKQDDNMTIWQFDGTIQKTINHLLNQLKFQNSIIVALNLLKFQNTFVDNP